MMKNEQPTEMAAIEAVITRLIALRQDTPIAEMLPEDLRQYTACVEWYQNLLDLRQFLLAIAQGDISATLPRCGILSDALQTLQANLRHLSWQTQMIAEGDYTQRVAFMSEFSMAFNAMVSRLEEEHKALTERNEELQREIQERQRLETAEHEQRLLAEALQQAGQSLTSSLEMTEVLDRVADLMRAIIPFDCGFVLLLEGEDALIARSVGDIADVYTRSPLPVTEYPFLQRLSETRGALVLDDQAQIAGLLGGAHPATGSLVGVALHGYDYVMGFLLVGADHPGSYAEKHAHHLAAFAGQVALAIQNARVYQDVKTLATTDHLTELANRRHFYSMIIPELSRASRFAYPLSVLLFDIDHFKLVIDTYGHLAGDAVLQQLARHFASHLRVYDLLARYGGEEFVLSLPQTDAKGALQRAERLRRQIESEPIHYGDHLINITISIGVSSMQMKEPIDLTGARKFAKILLEQADQALYVSKRGGRNCVTLWSEDLPHSGVGHLSHSRHDVESHAIKHGGKPYVA
jgi:diguanylate cyclase (GGDEF)-like protein